MTSQQYSKQTTVVMFSSLDVPFGISLSSKISLQWNQSRLKIWVKGLNANFDQPT